MALIDDIRALDASILAQQNTQVIADALPPRVALRKTECGFGTILSTLGPVAGAALLDTLDAMRAASRPLHWAWYLLERGVFDFGDPATRAQLDALAAGGVMTAEQAAALKAVGEVSTPVDEMEVRRACWSDAGEWLV